MQADSHYKRPVLVSQSLLIRRSAQFRSCRSDPTRDSAKGEEDGEHLGRDAHRAVEDAAVEVDIGVELSFDEILLSRALALGKVSLNSEPFCIRVQLTGHSGATWVTQTSGTANWLLDVSFTDANEVQP